MNQRVSSILWGILLILGAVALVMSQLGMLGGLQISVWKMMATIILLAIAVKNLFHRSFAGILFPIAIICILFDEMLGITALTPWTVLLVALLLSIALSMIFKDWCQKRWWNKHQNNDKDWSEWKHHGNVDKMNIVDEQDGEVVYSKTNFGGTVKYVNSDNFIKAYISNSFGETKLYFDKAVIRGEKAEIQVDCSFGEIQLFIPREWEIINKVNTSFAGVDEKNPRKSSVEDKEVYLTGSVSFGAVTILYV